MAEKLLGPIVIPKSEMMTSDPENSITPEDQKKILEKSVNQITVDDANRMMLNLQTAQTFVDYLVA